MPTSSVAQRARRNSIFDAHGIKPDANTLARKEEHVDCVSPLGVARKTCLSTDKLDRMCGLGGDLYLDDDALSSSGTTGGTPMSGAGAGGKVRMLDDLDLEVASESGSEDEEEEEEEEKELQTQAADGALNSALHETVKLSRRSSFAAVGSNSPSGVKSPPPKLERQGSSSWGSSDMNKRTAAMQRRNSMNDLSARIRKQNSNVGKGFLFDSIDGTGVMKGRTLSNLNDTFKAGLTKLTFIDCKFAPKVHAEKWHMPPDMLSLYFKNCEFPENGRNGHRIDFFNYTGLDMVTFDTCNIVGCSTKPLEKAKSVRFYTCGLGPVTEHEIRNVKTNVVKKTWILKDCV